MKRLVFCFDGTWNRLSVDTPTNVVLLAASISRTAADGTPQLIHYDEGVGTGNLERIKGGVFGYGLMTNVREAFRFLIFNYDPGDEIHVFGFSRGAFSARTFIGLLRHVGPLSRLHAARIDEAISLYRRRLQQESGSDEDLRRFRADHSAGVCNAGDDDWRCRNVDGYFSGSAPNFSVRFMGVWDTVGALGLPAFVPLAGRFNRGLAFHDMAVDRFVEGARHAVALDEKRRLFPPTLLGDLTELNAAAGYRPDDRKAPYQEQWFPGTHGSVGGGGDLRGLSDGALSWVLQGAARTGLEFDQGVNSRLGTIVPDPLAPLVNVKDRSFDPTRWPARDRSGPRDPWQLSAGALRRWQSAPERLPEAASYRPPSLETLRTWLDTLPPFEFTPPDRLLAIEVVKPGDTLGAYARRHYGDAELHPYVFMANLDRLVDADTIVPGQEIRIPLLEGMAASPGAGDRDTAG